MKSNSKERLPERVPFSDIPTGETLNLFAQADLEHLGSEPRDIAQWAHRMVWTDRMLETLLNNRVKGGKWHALIDKVYSELNLSDSARKVLKKKGAAGVDQQSVTDFAEHERDEIRSLHEELREGRYRPSPVRRVWIPKPGSQELRPLGIPTVRDRVVQTALVHVIEPILDHTFHERSFGFRRGRGCHNALRVVEEKLEAGYVYVVDADLKGYFDTIPKELEESAIMDGASPATIFLRIILPLAKPAVAVTALFSFMTGWNEFILAATFMDKELMYTAPVGLRFFVGGFSQQWGYFAAGSIIVSVPVVVLFLFLQKYLVSGLTAGAVKG